MYADWVVGKLSRGGQPPGTYAMRNRIELVVLDMDGTIFGRGYPGGISPRVRRTISAVQEAGTPVTIATGRVFSFVRAMAPSLGVTLPVITAQGAVVGDPVSGEVLHEALLSPEAARSVASWADGEERTTVFYLNEDGGVRLVQKDFPGQKVGGGLEGWDGDAYDHWFGSPRELHARLADPLQERGVRPLKFITVNDSGSEPDLTGALQLRFGGAVDVSRSHRLLVEGTAPNTNKGNGLLMLAGRLGIDPARVLVVGDNENDIPMMRVAGVAVSMGQASAAVRAEADWVAPNLEEDGAAAAMERFVLGHA